MTRPTAGVLVLLAILLALFWLAPEVPLLGFAAILLAIAIRAGADPLAARTGLPEPAAVAIVLLAVVLVLGVAAWAAYGPLAEQTAQLAEELPRSVRTLRERLQESAWAQWVLDRVDPSTLFGGNEAAGQGAGAVVAAAGRTLGVLGNALLVLLGATYLALTPAPYLNGLRALFHPALDADTRAALAEAGAALRGFLLGQAFAMAVTGALTWLGLWLLGVPLALLLAVITAVLGFIPVVGPVIAAVPAVLLAVTQGPETALWVALLYVGVQALEGNILTPMVQSRAADVPPALLIVGQLLLGGLYGLLGIALTAPLLALAIVLVRRGWVRGWLGRAADQPSG